MRQDDLSLMRLVNQQVSQHRFTKAEELVGWMGAMQAQDYGMVRWAVALRLSDARLQMVQRSIDKGVIIRTHVMRPTWHLVSAKDVRWMLDLTAPHIQASMKSRLKELELTPPLLNKSLKLLEQALTDGNHLTREELITVLEKNRISAPGQRAAYILIWAELEKVMCSGSLKGKKNTYAHFERKVKPQKAITRDAALQKLARRYFTSHGPATVQDFINWSGLPAPDAKKSLELLNKHLQSVKIGSATYWFADALPPTRKDSLYFLPAFDEFIIAYKDRSACLPAPHKASAIAANGMFWPVVVFNGQVIGLWRKTLVRKEVKIDVDLFSYPAGYGKKMQGLLADASEEVSKFFSPGLAAAE